MKGIYKKISFHKWYYQDFFQKKNGKKVARGMTRARIKDFLLKNLD